ncbi:uncharacterized protein RJT21DRAFT_2349 [Scheffersomyces amazonensis]|uniref:uncharacterized protein n=1 Tax=Scheffersomyces amazonensis TaxID=1078765 RepID=UPI00315DF689
MSSFRPYGEDDTRIVSDLSRFDFEQVTRNRSRNTTPTSLEEDKESDITLDSIMNYYDRPGSTKRAYYPPQSQVAPQRTLLEIAEEYPDINNPRTRPSLPPKDDRLMQRSKSTKSFVPYPPSVFMSVPYERANYANDLPPEVEPKDFMNLSRRATTDRDELIQSTEVDDIRSIDTKRKQLGEDLVHRVMNHPLYTFPGSELGIPKYQHEDVSITANALLYLLEMIFEIVVIVLASVLSNLDHRVSAGIYRYFIADGILSIIVCFMFMANIINFEKRNGSFYCSVAFLLKLVSFIMIISYIIPKKNCEFQYICNLRQACSAFIITSTFSWLINLIVFFTTLYISRLNLLDDINFDFSNKGISREYNKRNSQETLIQENKKEEEQEKEQLKEYYLNEKGEMYELQSEEEREQHKSKNKILVYTF